MSSLPFLLIWALFFLPAPVAIRITPAYDLAPGSFQATIVIERHGQNRALWIGFDGTERKESYYQIAGAQRQRIFIPKFWDNLSAGRYVGYAALLRIEDGRERRYLARQTFEVIE
jgi:hypothetical protein